MSGPFKMKYTKSAFPFKKGEYKKGEYKLETPETPKLNISKNISLTGQKRSGKKLSEVLPTGARGNISATYKPTKTLTLRGSAGGSISKYNPSTYGGSLTLQKKFKKGGFNIGVSKGRGSKTSFTLGGYLNI
jgi:hypothetical protein